MFLQLSNLFYQLSFNLIGDVYRILAADGNDYVFGVDMSIDSLRAQIFSDYIFVFLLLSLVLFCYIIYLYLPKNLGDLKLGEKIMFGSIIIGVILAVIIGYVQLIDGYLI